MQLSSNGQNFKSNHSENTKKLKSEKIFRNSFSHFFLKVATENLFKLAMTEATFGNLLGKAVFDEGVGFYPPDLSPD